MKRRFARPANRLTSQLAAAETGGAGRPAADRDGQRCHLLTAEPWQLSPTSSRRPRVEAKTGRRAALSARNPSCLTLMAVFVRVVSYLPLFTSAI